MVGPRWRPIVELIDAVTADPAVIDQAVRDVRVAVPDVGRLRPEDIARHTRSLLAAAVRAIADRRGPTTAELDFIEGLAVVRAQQQIPVGSVLTAVHVASRPVWRRSRELAAERGVPLELLIDARDLYDDWAEQVRARLIVAHRDAELDRARSLRDRRVELLRRALDGGPVAAVAVTEAGLDASRPVWVVHATPPDEAAAARLEVALRGEAADLFATLDGVLVGVVQRRPDPPQPGLGSPVGVVGPVSADELDVAALRARWTHDAAVLEGAQGVRSWDRSAAMVALASRPDLATALATSLGDRLAGEGRFAAALAATVVAYVEHDLRVDPTAASLYVHPNTVRHRLRRFTDLTGLPLTGVVDAATAWWLLRHAEVSAPGA